MVTTIQLDEKLKERLDKLKIHYRESYNDLILRLISSSSTKTFDKESLIETIEILSDFEAMKSITRGIEDYSKGRVKSLAQIKKELR
jgi:predicted transcriptional regulator